MKRILLVLLIALAACAKTEPKEYFQQNFSDVPAIGEKCTIGNIDYYVKGDFMYHVNSAGSRIVYSHAGEYLKPKGYPRWQFRTFLNKNDSIYTKTVDLINEGTPDGDKVQCVDVTSLPSDFNEWLSTHEGLYNAQKAEGAMEIA